MEGASAAFFDGVPDDVLESVLGQAERRRYPAGSVVIAQGESVREMYVAESGAADVFVADRQGVEHLVGHVVPGSTLGEMSLFTGQPAAGTVRATDDLEVLVLREEEFERLSSRFPLIYRNLGAILSKRLEVTNRLAVREEPGRLTVLEDTGAPPLLGAALASSLCWHTRASTLLVVLDDDPPEDLRALANHGVAYEPSGNGRGEPRTAVLTAPASGSFAPEALAETCEGLCAKYDHVLLQVRGGLRASLPGARTIGLASLDGSEEIHGHGSALSAIRAWTGTNGRVGADGAGIVRTPQLEAGDSKSLKEGLLPATTGAGRALGWAARDIAGLKVGVALGAGSLRGYAHFGVLRALERFGCPIDYLAGTSTGAAAAGLYAMGLTPDEAADVFTRCARALFRPAVPIKGLLSNRSLRKVLRGLGGDRRIEDLDLPLALVAADLVSQCEIVFRRGLLWQAVLASVSIPGVYPALQIGPYAAVDGGVLNPVPTNVVAEMGAGAVIGVRLIPRTAKVDMDAEAVEATGRPMSVITAIIRSIDSMQTRLALESTVAPTVLITPTFSGLPSGRLRTFTQGQRYVEDGEAAAEATLPRLAAALPWLRA